MRRSLLLASVLSLALNACMPAFIQQAISSPTPVVDVMATATSVEATEAAQTLVSLPTATLPPTATPPPPATATLVPTLPPTSTPGVDAAALTGTPTLVSAVGSETPTLGVRYFGTIPPLVPSGRIVMINRAHAEAYISFQCINKEGTLSILEYPVGRWMEVRIPSGNCKYVAWVGGREFIGKVSVDTGGQKKMVFFIDHITIK